MLPMTSPPHRVHIPEHLAQIESNFLAELWNTTSSPAEEKKSAVLLYYLQRGIETVTSLPLSNSIAIFTFAISLFFFAGFVLLLKNVEQAMLDSGSELFITAYLHGDLADAKDLEEVLAADSRIERVQGTSKAQALKFFEKELRERKSFLEGLRENNPLPASIDIFVRSGERAGAQALIADLKQNKLVAEVIYGSDWYERVETGIALVRFLGMLLGSVVLILVVFLIGNTIRLVIYSRRTEIEIMQLVGAPDRMISAPFLIGGTIQGTLGAALGLLLLWGCFLVFRGWLKGESLLGFTLPSLSFLSGTTVCFILIGGAAVGALSSRIAIGRHMNV